MTKDEFAILIQNDLNDAKELIHRLVMQNLANDEDMFKYDIGDYPIHMAKIADEIATAYTIMGHLKKEEDLANSAVKKAEAKAYMDVIKDVPKGAKQPTAEQIKRQCLTDDKLLQYYQRAGEAIKNRIIQEGIIEALKTKREILKTLAIKQHSIERGEKY